MKKSLLKLLSTIGSIIGIVFLQGFIRDYFGIDQRIWFFVQYIGGLFVFAFSKCFLEEDIKNYLKKYKQQLYNLKKHLYNIFKTIYYISIILGSAIIFFNILYQYTYYTYNWMKIITFIIFFIFGFNFLLEYIKNKKTLDLGIFTICIINFLEIFLLY